MNLVFLSLGSNLGNRFENLSLTIRLLNKNTGNILNMSSVYETEPWGVANQETFLNMVICLSTRLSIDDLLVVIQQTEKLIGREKTEKWKSRTMDIDILFFNQEVSSSNELKVPHPWLHLRRFVLVPLHEINPDLIHPVLKKSISQLLDECIDKLNVTLFEKQIIIR